MSRGRIIAAVVVLVVIALIAGGIALSASSRTPQVSVAEVTKQDITQQVTASGQLEGDVKADIFPPAAQAQLTIRSIAVADGQAVTAGQTLATLDPEPLDAAVAAARQGLKQAQSGLVQAQRSAPSSSQRTAANASVTAASQGLTAARAALANAQDGLDVATDQLNAANHAIALDKRVLESPTRYTPAQLAAAQSDLAARTAAASQLEAQLPQLRTGVAQARSGVAQAESGLAQARAGRDALKDQNAAIAAARAGVAAADEQLQIARQNRAKATLTSPIDGVVVFAGGGGGAASAQAAALGAGGGGKPQVGSVVSAASAPFTVFQLGQLNFNAQVDEADIANVGVGMKGSVTLDAFPGVTFTSKVVQVKTQAISTSTGGTAFPVLLSLKATGKRLLVGMGGNADIETSAIRGAVVVPVEALFDESSGTYVFVVDANNVVHHTKVKTGVMTDTQAQILSGVEPGQRVALGGLSTLKDGMTVRVK